MGAKRSPPRRPAVSRTGRSHLEARAEAHRVHSSGKKLSDRPNDRRENERPDANSPKLRKLLGRFGLAVVGLLGTGNTKTIIAPRGGRG